MPSTDESMMFHLTQGALRRWSLWNEPTLPQFALGEEKRWQMFQGWKNRPYQQRQNPMTGQMETRMHPMSEFENWPYWLIVELIRAINLPSEYNTIFLEPESLKKAIVDFCDTQYSDHEQEQPSNLFA